MKNLKANFYRTLYSEYEFKTAKNRRTYLIPTPTAEPSLINPLEDVKTLVLDALNVGMLQIKEADEDTLKEAVKGFVSKYGLLGFMTALPTTPRFTDHDIVYLPKNHFILAKSMELMSYIDQFFPFEKLHFRTDKNGELAWDLHDKTMIMTLQMSFQRQYAERFDWLARQFKDWATIFSASYLYYYYHKGKEVKEIKPEDDPIWYEMGVAAFGGISPMYHIELLDKPTMVWDFHSLSVAIQMAFHLILTGEKNPLRICMNCVTVFLSNRKDSLFCRPRCRNQFIRNDGGLYGP